ncbi:hypothetical protein HDV64DRAFT_240863, partial [Trichoderma sp. TUCIM 5745]
MSRRDTTSKEASPILAKGPYPSPPLYLSTIILCLVVGLHQRTAPVGSLECCKKKISLPNGPCMHCHVDDKSGKVCRVFSCTHSECSIRSQFVPFWAANQRKTPPGIRASSLFPVRHAWWWRGSWFDCLLPALHISSHRLHQRNTVMASHISLTLGSAGGLCQGRSTNIQRAKPLRPHMHLIGLFGARINPPCVMAKT